MRKETDEEVNLIPDYRVDGARLPLEIHSKRRDKIQKDKFKLI